MSENMKTEFPTQSHNNANEEKIGLMEKVGFGLGDLACNFVWGAMGTYVVYFYTDVVGVAAGIIGTIMLFSVCLMA